MSVNTLKVGQKFRIVLNGNPTTGYSWQYNISGDDVIDIQEGYVAPNTMLVGRGGQFIYEGTAVAPGNETVTFTYSRPWENTLPADTKVYHFRVSY
jgi:inhibitor of cysteine peptidase